MNAHTTDALMTLLFELAQRVQAIETDAFTSDSRLGYDDPLDSQLRALSALLAEEPKDAP